MHKKLLLEYKTCKTCHRSFSWRKKWAKVWDKVLYCSKKCKKKL